MRTRDRVLRFIRGYISAWGFPPSMDEIGEAVGLKSRASVSYQLEMLQREAKILRIPGRSRAIKVVEEDGDGAG